MERIIETTEVPQTANGGTIISPKLIIRPLGKSEENDGWGESDDDVNDAMQASARATLKVIDEWDSQHDVVIDVARADNGRYAIEVRASALEELREFFHANRKALMEVGAEIEWALAA